MMMHQAYCPVNRTISAEQYGYSGMQASDTGAVGWSASTKNRAGLIAETVDAGHSGQMLRLGLSRAARRRLKNRL